MNIRKPKRASLSSQIVEEMERIIRQSQWPVGERIPSEPELMKLFGVSRNTVREALQSLIHAGLLVAKPGDGTYVQGKTRMERVLHNELSGAGPEQACEARLVLEMGVAGLAAQNRTAADLTTLRTLLDRRNADNKSSSDAEFHMAVACATHNRLLTDFYNEICRYMLDNLVEKPSSGEMLDREITLHENLYRAISGGDADSARHITSAIVHIYGELQTPAK